MDWILMYREEADFLHLLEEANVGLVDELRIYPDAYNNIIYLEAHRS